jgi:hypothetical protein
VLQPDDAGDGTDVDNVSRTLAPHDGQRSLHQVHDAVEIRRELLLNLGGGHLLEIAEQTVARIVDQDVDASKALRRLIDRRFGLCLSGNVKLEKSDALRRYIGNDLCAPQISAGKTTRSPANAALATPAPMPLPAPVINQTLLLNICSRLISLYIDHRATTSQEQANRLLFRNPQQVLPRTEVTIESKTLRDLVA